MAKSSCTTYFNSTPSPSSSSSSSSSSHSNSSLTPPQLSSSTSSSSSAIPFSWEKKPGIPKKRPETHSSQDQALPLPPPLKSKPNHTPSLPRKKKPDNNNNNVESFVKDPFAVALMECSKEETRWKMSSPPKRKSTVARSWPFLFGFRFWDLSGSCRSSTGCVAESTVYVPRSGRAMLGAYGLVNRRPR